MKATEEPITITVTVTYNEVEYSASFKVSVVESGVVDGIALLYSGNELDLSSVFQVSANAMLYAYPTINGTAYTSGLSFTSAEFTLSGSGLVGKEIAGSDYGYVIQGNQCTEGATGTLAVQAIGMSATLSLEVPKKEYLCGLRLYSGAADISISDITAALDNLGITGYAVGSNYVELPSVDVGSDSVRQKYYEMFKMNSPAYSTTAFAETVNDLFFGGSNVISAAAVGTYYFAYVTTSNPNYFVLYLKILPGETATPDPTQPVTLKLVNLNGGDLTEAAGGGYSITASDITEISDYCLYDTIDVNTQYKGDNPDDPVTSWQYAMITYDGDGNPTTVTPLSSEIIRGSIILTDTDVVLLARHDTVDHYIRVVMLEQDQQTDLIAQNYDKYDEVDDLGKYDPVSFDETAADKEGNLLDHTYKVSLTQYNSLYDGSHADSADERAKLLAFLVEQGLTDGSKGFYSTSATQYHNVWAGHDIAIEDNEIITEGSQLVIVTFIVSLRTPVSGGTYEPRHSIDISSTEGGTVVVTPKQARQGEVVTITVYPDEGYKLDTLTVTDKNGDTVKLSYKDDNKYTFTMPASLVTVTATFTQILTTLPFTDVPEDAWYIDAVRYVYEHGLMTGTSATAFSPDATTSRSMIATILWRLAGSPVVNYTMDYPDISQGQWYSEAVRWATSEGVVTGYDNGLFGANDPITREQFVTMLWRYAQSEGYDVSVGENTNILSYTDVADLSEYAIPAMQWAVGAGIITGTGDGSTLSPQGEATRAQAAMMLMRFCEEYMIWPIS